MLRLEFAAVQIIAVDTVRNSGLHIAGYPMKAGHPIQNTVSTGDLNRGRRACPACFLCYFLHAAKSNSPFPFRELPDKQEARPCWGSTLRVLLLPFSLKHGRLAHIRSQFSLFRRSPTHKNLPLASFCASEQGVPRFCKPRISSPQRRFRWSRFAAFPGASGRRPLLVHAKRVQIHHASRA